MLRGFQAGKKALGRQIARTFIRRVEQISALDSRKDCYDFAPFRFHALKGERVGEYSIRLDDQMRLIITVEDAEGSETIVWLEEVSKHYDD